MTPTVECVVTRDREVASPQVVRLDLERDVTLVAHGAVGPRGISPEAADLLDVGTAVFEIERRLRGNALANPPTRFQLRMRVRRPQAWRGGAADALVEALRILGGASWEVDLERRDARLPEAVRATGRRSRVVLFSGGLDSTCGLAASIEQSPRTVAVSFYTRQRSAQREIAAALGYAEPLQWSMARRTTRRLAHPFRYRSLLFLTLAVVTADSWGIRSVTQYENGVLASGVPPAYGWVATRHAHAALHAAMAKVAGTTLGGRWTIVNPFSTRTKRECYLEARAATKGLFDPVAARTESCWFRWSNHVTGGDKRPGRECGVCVPCIVRRTALRDASYQWDLRRDTWRNDDELGRAFRAYYGLLGELRRARSDGEFVGVLPIEGRELVAGGWATIDELRRLFATFATEFGDTFGVGGLRWAARSAFVSRGRT